MPGKKVVRTVVRPKHIRRYFNKRTHKRIPQTIRLKRTKDVNVNVVSNGPSIATLITFSNEITAGNVAGNPFTSVPFTLNLLPNYTEFTNIADSYQITGIKVKFTFRQTMVNPGDYAFPILHWVHDDDDGTDLADINEACQYETYQCRRMDKPITIFVRPKVSFGVYNGVASTGYVVFDKSIMRHAWTDCTNADVQYFGLKGIVDITNNGVSVGNKVGTLNVQYTYYLRLKDVR